MNVRECWTEIDGHRMRLLKAGVGPPLLLIHGLLGGSFCWRFSLPVFAEKYSVRAIDLPGLGLSDDAGADCSISRQSERLLHWIEQMRWNNLAVIGCSLGGAIAMLLAARDAELSRRIRSLVLVAPVNPWSDFGQGRIRFLSTVFGGCLLRLVLPISRPCHKIAVRRMYGDPRLMSPDAVEGYSHSVLRRGRAKNVLTALRSWFKDLEILQELIPQIKVPVFLVWGDRDGAVDPRSAAVLLQKLSRSELKLIAGAGHLPFEEKPEEFNDIVMDFLQRH